MRRGKCLLKKIDSERGWLHETFCWRGRSWSLIGAWNISKKGSLTIKSSRKETMGRCSSKLAQLLLFLNLDGGLLVILIDSLIFLSTFLDVIRISMSTVSFLAHVDSLLYSFQHILLLVSFLFFFLLTPYFLVAV